MKNLKFIYLEYNNVLLIESFFLNKFDLVKSIFLRNNNLRNILSFSFMNMKELLVVNLDNNLIESIQMNSFFNLTNIRFISLRNNLIKAIFEFSNSGDFGSFEAYALRLEALGPPNRPKPAKHRPKTCFGHNFG